VNSEIAPHVLLPEPMLSFHSDRESDQEIHPLRGLLRFGPHSKGLVPDPIRVATISPKGDQQHLYRFLKQLNSSACPTERKNYLPDWPGFHNVFGVRMSAANKNCHIELDEKLEADVNNSETPHSILTDHIIRVLHQLETQRTEFDVVYIYLPQRWKPAFQGGKYEDFDLHDHLKATTARLSIPIQLVREDKALAYPDRASVMWRIGLALYAKAGGVPWKLADIHSETAYIGISYALRSVDSSLPRFVTCCSQVFDAEGSGLEFVAYDAHDYDVYGDNPFLSRTEMFSVMTRSLELYRRRHAGRTPRKVIVHKTTEFKKEEVVGCMEALHLCESVDLIQIIEDVQWRGIKVDSVAGRKKGESAPYPVSRGTLININPYEALLWTHGEVSGIDGRRPYFQGARSTPQPIRLVRHAGHGSWDESARAVLALSKMNWNNDNLYDTLPVTIGYAKVLARVIKRMNGLGSTPYQFRFFM